MIFGIGMDLVETERIKKSMENYGDRFVKRIFTDFEIEYCELYKDTKHLHYAARFAAKEAFSKAIGTGITKGFKFADVAVKNEMSGKPYLVLGGEMKEKYGEKNLLISLTHTDTNAGAMVILEEN